MSFKIKNDGFKMYKMNNMHIFTPTNKKQNCIYIKPKEDGYISFEIFRNDDDIEKIRVKNADTKLKISNEINITIKCDRDHYITIDLKLKTTKCIIRLANIRIISQEEMSLNKEQTEKREREGR